MRERFRLVGVTVGNDGATHLLLACTQEEAYRWSFKGERVVELSEVTEPENDAELRGVPRMARFLPEGESDDTVEAPHQPVPGFTASLCLECERPLTAAEWAGDMLCGTAGIRDEF